MFDHAFCIVRRHNFASRYLRKKNVQVKTKESIFLNAIWQPLPLPFIFQSVIIGRFLAAELKSGFLKGNFSSADSKNIGLFSAISNTPSTSRSSENRQKCRLLFQFSNSVRDGEWSNLVFIVVFNVSVSSLVYSQSFYSFS